MDTKLLDKLIKNGECQTVDFKEKIYDVGKGKLEKDADFIKDLISLANTIRNSSAYIIIGIKEKPFKIVGLDKEIDDKEIDDNTFQTFVKNKITPRPNFIYYNYDYKGKKLGIFEILHIPSLSEPVVYDDSKNKDELEKKNGKNKSTKSLS